MGYFDFDMEEILKTIDDLGRQVPEVLPEACEKAQDVVQKHLIRAAPHRTGALKQSIYKGKPRRIGDGARGFIFVSPRGKKDRNVYKAVVSEFGSDSRRHKQAAKPWWRDTVQASEYEALEAAAEVIHEAVDRL